MLLKSRSARNEKSPSIKSHSLSIYRLYLGFLYLHKDYIEPQSENPHLSRDKENKRIDKYIPYPIKNYPVLCKAVDYVVLLHG